METGAWLSSRKTFTNQVLARDCCLLTLPNLLGSVRIWFFPSVAAVTLMFSYRVNPSTALAHDNNVPLPLLYVWYHQFTEEELKTWRELATDQCSKANASTMTKPFSAVDATSQKWERTFFFYVANMILFSCSQGSIYCWVVWWNEAVKWLFSHLLFGSFYRDYDAGLELVVCLT